MFSSLLNWTKLKSVQVSISKNISLDPEKEDCHHLRYRRIPPAFACKRHEQCLHFFIARNIVGDADEIIATNTTLNPADNANRTPLQMSLSFRNRLAR